MFQLPCDEAVDALETWIGGHAAAGSASPEYKTKVCLITRIASGFRSPDALITLAMLNLGSHRPGSPRSSPVLPGRTRPMVSQDSQNSVSGITYISVIPDTEFDFFLDAARPGSRERRAVRSNDLEREIATHGRAGEPVMYACVPYGLLRLAGSDLNAR